MIRIQKVDLQVFITENEKNECAKCCKTIRVIERMMEAFPNLKDKIELSYKSVNSNEVVDKYGDLTEPVVLINNSIFSEGHVPVIKKLSREILDILK